MGSLNSVDYTVILIYFGFLVALGLFLRKKASQSLEDYFLGGRKLPWWALGLSGMATWLDVTGTMIITSFLFILGPRGLFIEFRGGAVLIAAVAMLWIGKWHRRSRCITGAEWMSYRFGTGLGGNFARLTMAVAMIIFTLGMLLYMIKGVSLFLSMFVPIAPFWCAVIMITIAMIYTMMSGFYGVVFTDVLQSGIVLIAVIAISLMAIVKIGDVESISQFANQITGSEAWGSSIPHWNTPMPEGYKAYEDLFMFALFYLIRMVIGGMGEGAEPKYFGARNDRECGKLTALTISTIMFRWPMMLGFAILGLFLVKDLFPDQSLLAEAAVLIKQQVGDVSRAEWADVLAGIMNHPEQYSSELVANLQQLMGESWRTKLHLVSYEGTVNAERILPAVILFNIPMGMRGLLLIALIAASMSTFDTNINVGVSFFVRDLYQRFLRPTAKNRELIMASYLCILVFVIIGFIAYYTVDNINDIWGWIMMGLGTGLMVPKIIRFYWWRYNGSGFAIGMLSGMIAAVIQRFVYPDLDERLQFTFMLLIGLMGSIIGTYLSSPTDRKTLTHFYRTTRPFGLWKPLESTLPDDVYKRMKKEHFYDLVSLPFAVMWQITLFLLPMQLIIKSYHAFFITGIIFLISSVGLYLFWYTKLPEANFEEDYEKTI